MDDHVDSIQEDLVPYIGKFITVKLYEESTIAGTLLEVGGGRIIIKTDNGRKICRLSDIRVFE